MRDQANRRVLIVDDSPAFTDTLSRLLRAEGFAVHVGRNHAWSWPRQRPNRGRRTPDQWAWLHAGARHRYVEYRNGQR